ncbi:LOW QUALITY PROTEIN: alpha-protein kinase 3 [Sphaeramia orbicularis]|uniref:LOW QUALITY PROTEIN: alpha-protein kinase 3 n=1 Tax=Sphaeramia orbicularis TaxID=375764 RepID=UPI00118174D5|nr:LOW QUALITY PROTEIN: alpha-protein kinase 3-like [Sphaeramia orbicularis]
MTSRRPMTRTFSGNGRTSSFSEEEGSSSNGRSESRNTYLSNVRPENRYSHYRPSRSTLCTVMAQLTEDIQPSFDTTLKSKAVSENCNVKFTCVVSGYPAPELKWYKDDMEMDRYCGLPKYEIHRNGKTHTLHIYNCTLDDAAIYQVSASNSKGIVSCSGVLEVGTMDEFKIHQRFFAKLKQKAEKKKRDLEGQKKEDKENIKAEKPQGSPERPPRKRPIPQPEQRPALQEPEAVEQLGATAETNGVSSEVKETPPVASIDNNVEKERSAEALAKKKMKISNGVDAAVNSSSSSSNRSHMMGNGGENHYDGGISLAQFLAETLQSQAVEEKQNSVRGENCKDTERKTKELSEQEKTQEKEREKVREHGLAIERETEKERQLEISHTGPRTKPSPEVKRHSKAHKDHDHHNIQTSISSMLHTVKDFFFGKNKRDSNDRSEPEFDHPGQPETPPSVRLQPAQNPEAYKPLIEDTVSMEIEKPKQLSTIVEVSQQPVSQESLQEDSVLYKDLPPAHKPPPEIMEQSPGHSVKEADDAVEPMEVSLGARSNKSSPPAGAISLSSLQVLPEVEETACHTLNKVVPFHQKDRVAVLPQPNHQTTRDDSSTREHISVLPHTQAPCEEEHTPTSAHTCLEDRWTLPNSVISATNHHGSGESMTDIRQEEEMMIDKMGKEDTAENRLSNKLWEEEKAEVKSSKQPCSHINRSETTKLASSSLEERLESCESKIPHQVLLPLTAITAHSTEKEHSKVTECTSVIQEMNIGFPPTAAPQSSDTYDLQIGLNGAPSVEEESTESLSLSSMLSSNSSEGKSEFKETPVSSLVTDLKVNSCDGVKIQEPVVLECENTEAEISSQPKKERKESDYSKSFLTTQNSNDNILWEPVNVAEQDGNKKHSEMIPQIQTSTFEDTQEIKPVVPDINPDAHITIPKIEVIKPEQKECTLPLTILAVNETESSSASLQKCDATGLPEVIIQDHSVADTSAMLPSLIGLQNDFNLSPTEKVKEVAQLDDKTKIYELDLAGMTSSEQHLQTDYSSIPIINISCTDDKEEDKFVHGQVTGTTETSETSMMPLFVVPPISVTCHESDSELKVPSQRDWTETETVVGTQRGTKQNTDSDSSQKTEEMEEKGIIERSPSMVDETLIPNVSHNVPSLSKTTENNTVDEILNTKPVKHDLTAKVCANVPSFNKTGEDNIVNDVNTKLLKDSKVENSVSIERLSFKPPIYPSLSPASLRKSMSKSAPDSDAGGDRQSDKADEDLSGGSTPTSSLSCENSPRLKRRDSLSLIRSATPEELASGARRKIFMPKPKEDGEGATVTGVLDNQNKKETPYMSPSQARRAAFLQASTGQNTPPMERRSPLLNRRKATLEVPKAVEQIPTVEVVTTKQEEKPAEKKPDPLKAPQVIRKIRGEPFPDASGHLKLWCQFFNVLSDSTIKWYRDEEEILEVKRSGGDESQVALAIVLATSQDCGVYGCTINNEYGSDTTDFLLSVDILSEILLKDDLEVGEEIEMTPLLFSRGLADSGSWGDKYFGRVMTTEVHLGEGCTHKSSKMKVIYGLDPVFESGSTCIIKVQNPIAYGTKMELNLAERNLEITKQECKVQNLIREYCKIFAAEARVIENFGSSLEVVPQFLMYRPANSVPYATVEADLEGVFQQYCMTDPKGQLISRTVSEIEQKCCTFQHWLHQWTHGNLLVTRLEGVETKLTNIKVVTKSQGYQGLTENGSPEVFEQFVTHHQCNYYCGLLGLRPLKIMDSLQQPTKMKGSRSPLLNRKLSSGSGSPQLQKKGSHSPQMLKKTNSSPKVSRKVQETEDVKSGQVKAVETAAALETR